MQQDVPYLTTALTGPLHHIEKQFLARQNDIEAWFRRTWTDLPLPITSSVDIRNAGFKVAPVDTNLFPAGFNNLNRAFLPLCIQAIQSTLQRDYPKCTKILLIPESHTRNPFYLESLGLFKEMLDKAGYEVRVGSLREDMVKPIDVELANGKSLRLEPVKREGDKLVVDGFRSCLIILNNDLADGLPEIMQGLSQSITPPPSVGWHARFKSEHFRFYDEIVEDFAANLDLDPWLINPYFDAVTDVDLSSGQGEQLLAEKAKALFEKIQRKYDDYEIKQKPFVVVKTDAGSYGMGVMMITEPDQIISLNRKQRQRMATTKGGKKITQVIMQEGVYSIETWGDDEAVSEPVVYLLGQHVVGGFYRIHTGRGVDENLNAPGMEFKPLAFMESCNNPDVTADPNAMPNRFYVYGVIARLAMLAGAKEIQQAE